MSSWTAMLSATTHFIPASSTIRARSATASRVQSSPHFTSCRAVTMPAAPAWRMSLNITGSLGPYHLQLSIMSGRIKGLTVHAGGSAFHHFFHFRQRGRGGIPRSGHGQRAVGTAAVHGVLRPDEFFRLQAFYRFPQGV